MEKYGVDKEDLIRQYNYMIKYLKLHNPKSPLLKELEAKIKELKD